MKFHHLLCLLFILSTGRASGDETQEQVKVFVFAGQSNMVGSDSKVADIKNFPPFAGLETPQDKILFSYCLGREKKKESDGFVPLQPVNKVVGPELSFGREILKHIEGRIAIIKIAAGGTHLGGDWNPDKPQGFQMYPLALNRVRSALAQLKEQGFDCQLEAFFWHQGENDMFVKEYRENYGDNLQNFIARWRKDLDQPKLPFFVGELCTKTIWGMDHRPNIYAISVGQKSTAEADPSVTYVPTNHIGVEIGREVGLHYHYGTLGQLQHGLNYAEAYLTSTGKSLPKKSKLDPWPYPPKSKIDLIVLAGHRNMEGERAFVHTLNADDHLKELAKERPEVAFKYSLGGGYKKSVDWVSLGPTGFYDTFGPELSLANSLRNQGQSNFAIAKFTHSGSQIIDWTPEGSVAKSRMLYDSFINYIKTTVDDLKNRGHDVTLKAIIYHVGENDMSYYPYRKESSNRVASLINQSRKDLQMPKLRWVVTQQPPTDHKRVNEIDVVKDFQDTLGNDPHTTLHLVDDLPTQNKQLVIDSAGIVHLGKVMARLVNSN